MQTAKRRSSNTSPAQPRCIGIMPRGDVDIGLEPIQMRELRAKPNESTHPFLQRQPSGRRVASSRHSPVREKSNSCVHLAALADKKRPDPTENRQQQQQQAPVTLPGGKVLSNEQVESLLSGPSRYPQRFSVRKKEKQPRRNSCTETNKTFLPAVPFTSPNKKQQQDDDRSTASARSRSSLLSRASSMLAVFRRRRSRKKKTKEDKEKKPSERRREERLKKQQQEQLEKQQTQQQAEANTDHMSDVVHTTRCSKKLSDDSSYNYEAACLDALAAGRSRPDPPGGRATTPPTICSSSSTPITPPVPHDTKPGLIASLPRGDGIPPHHKVEPQSKERLDLDSQSSGSSYTDELPFDDLDPDRYYYIEDSIDVPFDEDAPIPSFIYIPANWAYEEEECEI